MFTMTPLEEWSCAIAIILHIICLFISDCRTSEWRNQTHFTCELRPWANASAKGGALPGWGAILGTSSWPGPRSVEINRWQPFEVHCHKTWHDCVSLQLCHVKHQGIWNALVWEETCQDWRGREVWVTIRSLYPKRQRFSSLSARLEMSWISCLSPRRKSREPLCCRVLNQFTKYRVTLANYYLARSFQRYQNDINRCHI